MDIAGWLRSLGLGQYEAAFRDNEIDSEVLPNLTAEDLKDLGVSIVGHRRTLLDGIAALRTDIDAKALPADAVSTIKTSPRAPSGHGDVFGPRRFYGIVHAHGPRRPARCHFVLPKMRRRDCASLRWVCSEIH